MAYMYIVVRTDLSVPQQCVQAGHAILEMTRTCFPNLTTHPSMVIVGVKNEYQLRKTIQALVEHGKIPFAAFREPDRDNEFTALATVPLSGKDRDFFKKYQLIKGVSSAKAE